MKTLLTILFTLGIAPLAWAQSFIPKEYFNDELNLKNNNTAELVFPGYQAPRLLNDSVFSFQLPELEKPFKKKDNFFVENLHRAQFRMPVASVEVNSNMPVMIPESTVNYALKIKKIPALNPLDNNPDSVPKKPEVKNNFKTFDRFSVY
ncbi:MAG: hypothetical protein JW761_13385 [Prolixibacteraceae bacterium]|nr:hypothetical protein [Prolixibacteraceae bacterium]